jgi:hypothetical protein
MGERFHNQEPGDRIWLDPHDVDPQQPSDLRVWVIDSLIERPGHMVDVTLRAEVGGTIVQMIASADYALCPAD